MVSNKKRLLIAGGGYADIPLIQAARRLGFYVITSGNRKNDLGHSFSDECHLEDFSDKRAMLKLAQSLRIDAVCACCNDFSALSAAYVAEQMSLPGHDSYETAKIIHHKDLYRRFARKHGIHSPYAEGYSSVEDALSALHLFKFPIIIKPVDLTGGKGISIISVNDNPKEALKKAFKISKAKRVVVEEFIEGSRHGLTTFLRNGQVVFHFSDNEHYYLNPFLVSAASAPGDVPSDAVEMLCKVAEKIASLLSLKTGIFHIQYILRQNKPIIVEICRRAPGDLYIKFVQYATGIDYPEFIVKAAAGMDCSNLVQAPANGYFTRHCVMASRTGDVLGIIIDHSIQKNIIDQFMWWKVGDQIKDCLTHKLGIVFLKFNSMSEMLKKTEKMQELILVEMSSC